MKNKINVANLLKDMPKGIKLYDWLHNIDVELDEVATTEIETVIWCTKKDEDYNELFGYSQLGTLRGWFDGLQILFPSKEMRDWSKFLWKKGDVLANGEGDYCVFKEFAHSSYQTVKAVFVKRNKESIHSDSCLLDTKDWHKASHSCTATYINTIEKELSGKLNMETLEIEKTQPEFKDGDILVTPSYDSNKYHIFIFSGYNEVGSYNYYIVFLSSGKLQLSSGFPWCSKTDKVRYATEEEKLQLFDALEKEGKRWDSEKKEVVNLKPKVELKPFDKVLVRDFSRDKWSISFFSFKKEGCYVCINHCSWNQCIPYIGNESLLGTTKDVEG
jgi:hypothetical protein|nr:MAG TPA: hypothetical protein [Caudoviricetes sp.]